MASQPSKKKQLLTPTPCFHVLFVSFQAADAKNTNTAMYTALKNRNKIHTIYFIVFINAHTSTCQANDLHIDLLISLTLWAQQPKKATRHPVTSDLRTYAHPGRDARVQQFFFGGKESDSTNEDKRGTIFFWKQSSLVCDATAAASLRQLKCIHLFICMFNAT